MTDHDYAGYEAPRTVPDDPDDDDPGLFPSGRPTLAPTSYLLELDPALWDRLVVRIAEDPEFIARIGDIATGQTGFVYAGRILNQTLAFLSLVADRPGARFSPSLLVDVGWHTFLLYTREYEQFCRKIAGRFIHHVPSDTIGVDYGYGNVKRTVRALRASGRTVDDMLWITDTMNCSVRLLDQKMAHDCGPCESVCSSVPDRNRP